MMGFIEMHCVLCVRCGDELGSRWHDALAITITLLQLELYYDQRSRGNVIKNQTMKSHKLKLRDSQVEAQSVSHEVRANL